MMIVLYYAKDASLPKGTSPPEIKTFSGRLRHLRALAFALYDRQARRSLLTGRMLILRASSKENIK